MISLEEVEINKEDMVAEKSKEEYGELIEKSAKVLAKYSGTIEGHDDRKIDLSRADDVEYLAKFSTEILMNDPDFFHIRLTAEQSGCKGFGFGVHCMSCKDYLGAEAITLWDPKCSCLGRTWKTKLEKWNGGKHRCCRCECAATVGLGITFYNKVPVSGTIAGVYWSIAFLIGFQVEWFLTAPETTDGVVLIPRSSITDKKDRTVSCANKGAIRISLLLGFSCTCCVPHVWSGTSTVCNSPFVASTYTITPQNFKVGVLTDLTVTITYNEYNGSPVNYFQNNSDKQTTLNLKFPNWMSDCLRGIVKSDDNVDDTQTTLVGLDNWNNPNVSTTKYPASGLAGILISLTYNGEDQSTWDEDLQFKIKNVVSNQGADPQNSPKKSTYTMTKLASIVTGTSIASGEEEISLQADIFNASMTFVLNVDGSTFTIVNNTSNDSLSGTVSITNSNAPNKGNAFYYIVDQGSNVAITETDSGNIWDMGYEFQQESGSDVYQIRPVMWQDGKPYTDRNKYTGVWVNIQSAKTSSTVYWNSEQNISLAIQVTLSEEMGVQF